MRNAPLLNSFFFFFFAARMAAPTLGELGSPAVSLPRLGTVAVTTVTLRFFDFTLSSTKAAVGSMSACSSSSPSLSSGASPGLPSANPGANH